MDFRLRTLTLASIAIVALGLTSVVTPVHPREKGVHGRHAVNANKNRHCVMDLSKPDTPTTCYDTFTAAIAAATRGRITDAPADSRVAMNDERFVARVYNTADKKKEAIQTGDKKKEDIQPREFGVIGTIFYDDGFGSPTLSFNGETCDNTVHNNPTGEGAERRIAFVGSEWNDDFESFRGGNNCFMRVWEHRDFLGVSTDWHFERSDLGVLNDEGSALAFD